MGVQLPLGHDAPLLRITADQLEAMAATGVLAALPRIELRDGVLCAMNPQHFPHGVAKADVYDALLAAAQRLSLPLRVISEVSVRVSATEVPIPDIFLVQRGRYRSDVPVERVRLIVEIADATLAGDLGRKLVLYASSNVPEYWVVDLQGRVIHQSWEPSGSTYARTALVPFGTALASVTLSGLVISTAALLDDSE